MSSPPFTPSTSITLKADTGATNHFISTNDLGYLQVKPPTELHPPINALVPTGHTMTSKGHVHLPISHIPPSASLAHVMPKLASGSLMSVGKICDADCTAIFDSTSVKIYQNKHVNITTKNKPIIYGTRNSLTKPLYSIQLPTIHHINTTIHNPTIRNRVAFYHKALFSPTVATWLNAHKNKFLESWPAITATQITKYAPFSIATIQGHRHAHRSNIRSTKSKTGPLPLTYTASINSTEEIVRTNNIFIDNIEITGRTFSDQTVESCTYGSELVAMRIVIKNLLGLRYKLHIVGMDVEKCSTLLGDNNSVIVNTQLPLSSIKKKPNSVAFHKAREAVAAGYARTGHIASTSQ